MHMSRNAKINLNIPTLLDKCKSMSVLKQIHSILVVLGQSNDDPFASRILSFSALSDAGNVDYSYQFLLQLSNPVTFYWNTTIRGYSKSKNPNKSLAVFTSMLRAAVMPDHLTYPFLAKAAARLLELKQGSCVHCHVLKSGFESDLYIVNSLIHMYASCRKISYARELFDEMPKRNTVSWNSMLDGYAKCRDMISATEVFNAMPERDVVSWSSLIDGYVKSEEHREAILVFEKMCVVGQPKANEVTMVSVLCACAHLGALEQGRAMHNYIVVNDLRVTLMLRTSLVDMYAKCGEIDEALSVFHGAANNQTDVLLWNSMIGGLATHGFVKESLDMFAKMERVGVKPDEITYLCVLSACAHGGLVEEAWYFFESIKEGGMWPKSEHYACIVDVLARAGKIEEAYEFVCAMPMGPTASTLGALLSGCMRQKRLDIAEIVGRKLIELEPGHDGRYIGLSNVYAVSNQWEEAKTTREAMERKGVKKSPGFSWIESSGMVHRFIAHDKTHPCSEQVYDMLDLILSQVRPPLTEGG